MLVNGRSFVVITQEYLSKLWDNGLPSRQSVLGQRWWLIWHISDQWWSSFPFDCFCIFSFVTWALCFWILWILHVFGSWHLCVCKCMIISRMWDCSYKPAALQACVFSCHAAWKRFRAEMQCTINPIHNLQSTPTASAVFPWREVEKKLLWPLILRWEPSRIFLFIFRIG